MEMWFGDPLTQAPYNRTVLPSATSGGLRYATQSLVLLASGEMMVPTCTSG